MLRVIGRRAGGYYEALNGDMELRRFGRSVFDASRRSSGDSRIVRAIAVYDDGSYDTFVGNFEGFVERILRMDTGTAFDYVGL